MHPSWQRNSRREIIKPGFSTPLDAPMIPSFPFTFRDVRILTLVYRTDIDAIRRLLPEPLQPSGDEVMIHFYQMNDTAWLGPYNEVNVMVGAELPGVVYRVLFTLSFSIFRCGCDAWARSSWPAQKAGGATAGIPRRFNCRDACAQRN